MLRKGLQNKPPKPREHLHPALIMVAKEAVMIAGERWFLLIAEHLRPRPTAMLFITAEAMFLILFSQSRKVHPQLCLIFQTFLFAVPLKAGLIRWAPFFHLSDCWTF